MTKKKLLEQLPTARAGNRLFRRRRRRRGIFRAISLRISSLFRAR